MYTKARTTSRVFRYETQGDRITVDKARKSLPGWRVVWTLDGEYWMRSRDLSPLTPSPTYHCPV